MFVPNYCIYLFNVANVAVVTPAPHHSHEQQRGEEICQFEEASGSAGLPTTTGDRVIATSGETVQVKPLALVHLLPLFP